MSAPLTPQMNGSSNISVGGGGMTATGQSHVASSIPSSAASASASAATAANLYANAVKQATAQQAAGSVDANGAGVSQPGAVPPSSSSSSSAGVKHARSDTDAVSAGANANSADDNPPPVKRPKLEHVANDQQHVAQTSSSTQNAIAASSTSSASSSSSSLRSLDDAIRLARSHQAELAAWQESATAEMRHLQRMMEQSAATVERMTMMQYARPLTKPFEQIDQATQIPPEWMQAMSAEPVPAASPTQAGSRLARAAYSVAQQQATSGDMMDVSVDGSTGAAVPAAAVTPAASTFLTLDQLESRRQHLAVIIKQFQSSSGRKIERSLEPPRNKTHWDYVLAEMEWMAGDFQRERKWKTVLAKKVSRAVLTHHRKSIDREFRKVKEEVLQRRKRAAWVSREIKKFWANIGKLVKHKHSIRVEEEKKKQMDKHLEILVDQTETFSSKLAADLTHKPATAASTPAADAAPPAAASAAASSATAPSPPTTSTPPSAPVASTSTSPPTPAAATSTPAPSDSPSDDVDTSEVDVGRVDDILANLKGPTLDPRRSTRTHRPTSLSASASAAASLDDANDADFGEESSEDDDEETLSEEEEEASKEGGDKKKKQEEVKEEVNQLEAEAEMSIEELRKLYGLDREDEEEDDEEMEDVEEEEGEDSESEAADKSSRPSSAAPSSSPSSSPAASDHEDEEDEAESESEEESDEEGEGEGEGEKTNTTLLLEQSGAMTEEQRMTVASKLAEAAQPAGFTLKDTHIKTKVPHLIRGPGPLREYQLIGLDWMVSMYENGLNGILADEMGLGKTVMTIALLAHLAVEKGIWGQHLIVVPTSVIVNWEMEFKRWLPAFKILCYHGNAKERKERRKGWSDPNAFHVCITSYQLVLQDARLFKRKRWNVLVLDEAHNIKNFKSQRWQTLLHFRTHRRLLLTGTPLQNSVMELWALMHFLMPNIFQSQAEFKEWFSNPVQAMVEGKAEQDSRLISRLHGILRPFLLRRLKTNVAQQLPPKYEHVVKCKMSKRQRILYEEFMAASDTQRTLASGNYMGMMNVLMQLRKVCNHPDLFSGRPIVSPFDQDAVIHLHVPSRILNICPTADDADDGVRLGALNLFATQLLVMAHQMSKTSAWEAGQTHKLATPREIIEHVTNEQMGADPFEDAKQPIDPLALPVVQQLRAQRLNWRVSRRTHMAALNAIRTDEHAHALYGYDTLRAVSLPALPRDTHVHEQSPRNLVNLSSTLSSLVLSYEQRAEQMRDAIEHVCCIIPKARAKQPQLYVYKPDRRRLERAAGRVLHMVTELSPATTLLRPSFARQQLFFPDRYLLQYDCGKLQRLALLLREREQGGHRCLIFSQFSKMLDILESFLCLYGYKYLRMDGATPPSERQRLMERFNRDNRYFVFILSTRSGGIGVTLTGADSVIMYDSDWNPAADLQAQDRAHRIGQTREVHIFRLVTERSVEENILKKSNQKRDMNNMVIGDGKFSSDMLDTIDPRELLGIQAKSKTEEPRVKIEEVNATDATATTSATAPPTTPAASHSPVDSSIDLDRQRAIMAELEDEADRVALEQTLAETQQDLDDFNAGEIGEASKARAAAAKPAVASVRTLGKVGAGRRASAVGPSSATISAAFESALTPVQRYALHFAEFVDPVITAQQMKAAHKQMMIEEQKWREKQSKGTAATLAANAANAAVKEEKTADTAVKMEVDAQGTADNVRVKQEPPDQSPPASSTPQPSSSSVSHQPSTASSSPPVPSLSPSPSPSPSSTNSSLPKNVLAGNRLEDLWLLSDMGSDYSQAIQLHRMLQAWDDIPISYEFGFRQPEHKYMQMQQQQMWMQKQAMAAQAAEEAKRAAAAAGLPPPPPPASASPPLGPIESPFGCLPTRLLHEHPYFSSYPRKTLQMTQFKAALKTLQHHPLQATHTIPFTLSRDPSQPPPRTPFHFRDATGSYAIVDAPPSPTSDDYVSDGENEMDETLGLFSTPDQIMRMLGPRLRAPDRHTSRYGHGAAASNATPPQRRRIVPVSSDLRVVYVSSDSSDPVGVRIPWVRLKLGGIDRSQLALARAGVDYPAKRNKTTHASNNYSKQTAGTGANVPVSAVDDILRKRRSYEGLRAEDVAAVQGKLNMQALSATSIVLPPQKKMAVGGANNKPLPAAAAGGSATLTPTSAAHESIVKKKREGLFVTKPPSTASIAALSRLRPVDDGSARDRIGWSVEEDHILLAALAEYGPNWPLIAQLISSTPRLAGRLRTAREVQNRYAAMQQKKGSGSDAGNTSTSSGRGNTATPTTASPVPSHPTSSDNSKSSATAPSTSTATQSSTSASTTEETKPTTKKKKKKDKGADKEKEKEKEKDKDKGEKSKGTKEAKKSSKSSSTSTSSGSASTSASTSTVTAAAVPGQVLPSGSHTPSSSSSHLPPGPMSLGFGSKHVVSLVERAVRQLKAEYASVRSQLRSAFPPLPPPTEEHANKYPLLINANTHASHKNALMDAHAKLGLPHPAMGKTLMPHQIIQLRLRRIQQRQADPRQIHHQQQMAAYQQQHAAHAHGHPPSGGASVASSSSGSHPSHPYPAMPSGGNVPPNQRHAAPPPQGHTHPSGSQPRAHTPNPPHAHPAYNAAATGSNVQQRSSGSTQQPHGYGAYPPNAQGYPSHPSNAASYPTSTATQAGVSSSQSARYAPSHQQPHPHAHGQHPSQYSAGTSSGNSGYSRANVPSSAYPPQQSGQYYSASAPAPSSSVVPASSASGQSVRVNSPHALNTGYTAGQHSHSSHSPYPHGATAPYYSNSPQPYQTGTGNAPPPAPYSSGGSVGEEHDVQMRNRPPSYPPQPSSRYSVQTKR